MFPPRPALLVPTACAVALTLLLTGCSPSGADGPGPEPAIGAVPALLETRSLAFPLAPYVPDARQLGILDEAQDVLVDQCMRRYGFRYQLRRRAPAADEPGDTRRYGLSDAAEAARLGYENPRMADARKPPQQPLGPNEQLVLHGLEVDPSKPVPTNQEEAEASDAATTVVGGQKVPAGGCLRESALKLYAPTSDTVDGMVPHSFGFDGFTRSRKDSRVVKAIAAWSACMAEHGYTADNPMDPPPGIDEADLSGPKAIATAKQDVDCKQRTNLVGTWYTVETAYQKQLIERNAETLDRAGKQLDERMRLAASLIAAGA